MRKIRIMCVVTAAILATCATSCGSSQSTASDAPQTTMPATTVTTTQSTPAATTVTTAATTAATKVTSDKAAKLDTAQYSIVTRDSVAALPFGTKISITGGKFDATDLQIFDGHSYFPYAPADNNGSWFVAMANFYNIDKNDSKWAEIKKDVLSADSVTVYGQYAGQIDGKDMPCIVAEYIQCGDMVYSCFDSLTYDGTTTAVVGGPYDTTTTPAETTTAKRKKKKTTTTTTTINNPSEVAPWGVSGGGDYVATNLQVKNFAVLYASFSGDGNFMVDVTNVETGRKQYLFNEIDNYSGAALIVGTGRYDVEIRADGNWDLNASALSVSDATSYSGYGSCVTDIIHPNNNKWKITNDGGSNFIVDIWSPSGSHDNLVNEIGPYSGVVSGYYYSGFFFEVISDGNWSITPAE